MPGPRVTWGGSLHSTLNLLGGPIKILEVFLDSAGMTQEEVLDVLPYHANRSKSSTGRPDAKRFRDPRQVYQTAGLLYMRGERLQVTELGLATKRWLPLHNSGNRAVLGRHAAFALAAAQLRNPTGAGKKYASDMTVFPFAFIWRAMLALDNQINSDEINRALFRVRDEDDLERAIRAIAHYRMNGGNPDEALGEETESGRAKNDRIIPWVALASFGWTLINDKTADASGTFYTIPPSIVPVLREAARVRHRHRDFDSVAEYVEHVSTAAALPRDLR